MNAEKDYPPSYHALATIGKETEKVAGKYLPVYAQDDLFKGIYDHEDSSLIKIARAFQDAKWTDQEAAKILTTFFTHYTDKKPINLSSFVGWLHLHKNDYEAVKDCLAVTPPDEINIIRMLSRAGSQKTVFLATWRLTQKQIVLKKFEGTGEIQKRMEHETQSHPLSIKHPNIIETYYLKNNEGEIFLIEEYLPEVLNDNWKSEGIQEAANLLYDISDALYTLHMDEKVHGDIKPDNIGKRGEDYILLDFGICRPIAEFSNDVSATGSLRTRAPELLTVDKYEGDPTKADVWALGATIYNAITGRFPLIDKDEEIPRISKPGERKAFEEVLKKRVKDEWARRVELRTIYKPLDIIIDRALQKNPSERCTAKDIIDFAAKELNAFLRMSSTRGTFSPLSEYQQLSEYLPEASIIELMPTTEKTALKTKIDGLKRAKGFTAPQQEKIEEMLRRFV